MHQKNTIIKTVIALLWAAYLIISLTVWNNAVSLSIAVVFSLIVLPLLFIRFDWFNKKPAAANKRTINLPDIKTAPSITNSYSSYIKPQTLSETNTDISQDITEVGPYKIVETIHKGKMADLYLGVKESNGFRKKVVIKRLAGDLIGNKQFEGMLKREVKLTSLLYHHNIIRILDFYENQNTIIIEYIDGKNLSEILSQFDQGLAIDQSIFIAINICAGLDYAHTKKDDSTGKPLNIIHRNIKPDNIFISYEGEVKINDFGLSRASSEPNYTEIGDIKGTLSHMSPEQASGQDLNSLTDIYSFGVVFYEMLTGKRLFQFEKQKNLIEAINSIINNEIVPINQARQDIPFELNRIIMKCLEKDKRIRYQSAKEIQYDLEYVIKSLKLYHDINALSLFMKQHFKPN